MALKSRNGSGAVREEEDARVEAVKYMRFIGSHGLVLGDLQKI